MKWPEIVAYSAMALLAIALIVWLLPACGPDERLMKTLWNTFECVKK